MMSGHRNGIKNWKSRSSRRILDRHHGAIISSSEDLSQLTVAVSCIPAYHPRLAEFVVPLG